MTAHATALRVVASAQPSSMPWFRTYRADLHNRAIQELPAETCRFLMNVRCLAEHLTGRLPGAKDIAFLTRLNLKKVEQHTKTLSEAGLLIADDGALALADWRQCASDNSGELKRTQRLRPKLAVVCPETSLKTPDETCREPVPSQRETEIQNKNEIVEAEVYREREISARATPLADDARPTLADFAAAVAYGLDREQCEIEYERFCNNHQARGTLRVDWHKAFCSWLSRMDDFAR